MVAAAGGALAEPGDPAVLAYELTAKTRVSRTTFDYSYRITLRVDRNNFPGGATLTVTSSAAGTTVRDGTVTTGPLTAYSLAEPQDTFTIRQDRTVAFDEEALSWQVSGTRVSEPLPPLAFLGLEFLKVQGREGHEALMSIQTKEPAVGTQIARARFSQPVTNVRVDLIGASGAALGQYFLSPRESAEPAAEQWLGPIDVPNEAFHASVSASDSSGVPRSWTSASFAPSTTEASLIPGSLTLFQGESATVVLHIERPSAPGTSLNVDVEAVPGLSTSPISSPLSLDSDGKAAVDLTVTSSSPEPAPRRIGLPISLTPVGSQGPPTVLTLLVFVYPADSN